MTNATPKRSKVPDGKCHICMVRDAEPGARADDLCARCDEALSSAARTASEAGADLMELLLITVGHLCHPRVPLPYQVDDCVREVAKAFDKNITLILRTVLYLHNEEVDACNDAIEEVSALEDVVEAQDDLLKIIRGACDVALSVSLAEENTRRAG
ncbi:hypothetical protein AKJ09_00058 [Labilithrix luteola]|uniref:Uncharacterized protein n=1 Tax=Labilithrix luteola TaxID=1391654 RepID=A0A0K1PJV7_9BACT|nr:hypothetical protein [Labilithrix luteola]AKU93394.1 hypothetical protein AKJ09_00058 [Labilithrix luteola]